MFKSPSKLKTKDKAAFVATANNFNSDELKKGIQIVEKWGLEVILGKNCFNKLNQFAGADEDRLADLQWALDDPTIKVIFCIRGGYGTARIIDDVNFNHFKKSPKWIVGFSDVTTLHASIQKIKIQSIHGPMPLSYGNPKYKKSISFLQQILFGNQVNYQIKSHKLNRIGSSKAPVVGGNLTILCSLLGTPNELNTANSILFIEDIGENLYKVDRMINQLKRAGKFNKLKGLIVGHFTDIEDNKIPFGKNVVEIISEAIADFNFPVCYNFPSGHEPDNFPITLGCSSSMIVSKKTTKLILG